VRLAETKQVAMSALSLDDYRQISQYFEEDVYNVFDFDAAVARRRVHGGPAPEAVREQITHLAERLEVEVPPIVHHAQG